MKNIKIHIKNYKVFNIIFASIFGIIFLYSGVFSAEKNNHPIPSSCKIKPCASTGLSRSFSEIIRFNFAKAKEFNKTGIYIFSFFLIQFFMRLLLNLILTKVKIKYILYSDISFSIILYLYTFKGLLFY